MTYTFVVQLLTLAFATGGAWFLLKQAQKDVNGLGRKFSQHEKETREQFIRLALAVMVVCTAEQKTAIAGILLMLDDRK